MLTSLAERFHEPYKVFTLILLNNTYSPRFIGALECTELEAVCPVRWG